MKKNKFLILIVLAISIIFIVVFFQQEKPTPESNDQQTSSNDEQPSSNDEQPSSNAQQPSSNVQRLPSIWGNTLETGQTVIFVGILKKGAETGVDHCSEGFYLTDNTGIIQLRTTGEKDSLDIGNYLDEKVEVLGKYQAAMCEALICKCDDSLLVDTIKIVE